MGHQSNAFGTDVIATECKSKFKSFLQQFVETQIEVDGLMEAVGFERPLYIQKLEEVFVSKKPYLNVNCEHLRTFDSELYRLLILYPREVIPLLDMAANELFAEKFPDGQLPHPIKVNPLKIENLRLLCTEGQAQAHTNTQIVHPLQMNSQSHVGAQMQGHQFQKEYKDAVSYLKQVKHKCGNQPQVYKDFLDIMKKLRFQSIDMPEASRRVSNLFRGHPELIVGFNNFLPIGDRTEVQPNEQVSLPGTLGGGASGTGPTSLTILPGGPPSTSPLHTSHTSQPNHSNQVTLPHGNAIDKVTERLRNTHLCDLSIKHMGLDEDVISDHEFGSPICFEELEKTEERMDYNLSDDASAFNDSSDNEDDENYY